MFFGLCVQSQAIKAATKEWLAYSIITADVASFVSFIYKETNPKIKLPNLFCYAAGKAAGTVGVYLVFKDLFQQNPSILQSLTITSTVHLIYRIFHFLDEYTDRYINVERIKGI